MHWNIQATILVFCIVICTAQGRGSRRFTASSTPSPSSVQEVIAEEDVVVKNHRFQTRHGARPETRYSDTPSRQQIKQESPPEVAAASTRRTGTLRGDNEIIKTTSRSQSRQRAEASSTTRQYLSRNSRPTDTLRRRNDVDISTEEAVTRGSVRTRTEKLRTPSYSGRTTVEQEATTLGQQRNRNVRTRERVNSNQQESPATQTRSRTSSVRPSDTSQTRAGRGRSLALEEPTTQSLRPRGRGYEKAAFSNSKSSTDKFSDSKSNNVRYNEPSRTFASRANDQKVTDNAVPTRGRGRTVVRGRVNSPTEPTSPPPPTPSPSAQVEETLSTKPAEEIPSSSSELPFDTSVKDQLSSIDITQNYEAPLMQLFEDVSSEEVPLQQQTINKVNGNGVTPETTSATTKETLKEITTAKLSSEPSSSRASTRGRGRNASGTRANGNNRRNDNRATDQDTGYETVTRSSRRNSQRSSSRPEISSRSSADRPTGYNGGRGRSRSRAEVEVTTLASRGRNNNVPKASNVQPTSTPAEQTYEEKKINEELPSIVKSEVNKVFSEEAERQLGGDIAATSSTSLKQIVTPDNPTPNVIGRKLGRGSARASKSEVITCTCYTATDCNLVNCPHL